MATEKSTDPSLQRRAQRGAISKLLHKAKDITDDDEIPFKTKTVRLNSIVEQIDQKLKLLEDIEERIVAELEDDDKILEELEAAEEYRIKTNESRTDILVAISDLESPPANVNSASPAPSTSGYPATSHSKLPKLTLPTFTGDVLKWNSFWDSFECEVHNNQRLTSVTKFNYLKSLLEKEAAVTIAGLSLTNENYEQAVGLLKERYGQKSKIISTYMRALYNLPKPSSSLADLKKFYDTLETYIRGLEALGKQTDSYGDLLIWILQDKLSSETKRNLAREHHSNEWNLDEFREALKREIEIIESCQVLELPSIERGGQRVKVHQHSSASPGPSTAAALTISQNQARPTPCCIFCQEPHLPSSCTKIVSIEDRTRFVKDRGLCFNCLGGSKHKASECRSKFSCKICKKRHHTCLHPTEASTTVGVGTSTAVNVVNSTPSSEGSIIVEHLGSWPANSILLKTASAKVRVGSRTVFANILFDEGAQRSFVTSRLTTQLGAPVSGSVSTNISVFGKRSGSLTTLNIVNLGVEDIEGQLIPLTVLEVPEISAPISFPCAQQLRNLDYLKNLRLANPCPTKLPYVVDLLIGADFYWEFVGDDIIRGKGPTAVNSRLGYLLSGPVAKPGENEPTAALLIGTPGIEDVEKLWNLEAIGISPEGDLNSSDFLHLYQTQSVTFENGKYIARLPWKTAHPPLPTNLEVSRKRLFNLRSRLQKDEKLLKFYDDIIREQERRGYIERVPDFHSTTSGSHYIPHRDVLKDSSSTPVRIVYDCSCKGSPDSPSLNDCLEAGPCLLNDLAGILVRFRTGLFACTADIEKAFLQVTLHPDDRNYVRFLWYENPFNSSSELVCFRFNVVLFGATSSPFILNAVVSLHLSRYLNQVAKDLRKNIYVDNLATSTDDEQSLLQYFYTSRSIFEEAGMNLRNWGTNSPALKSVAMQHKAAEQGSSAKILGMIWDTVSDTLNLSERDLSFSLPLTKRKILQRTASVYDPLGLALPVTLRAKLLIQNLWKEKLDWDDPVPEKLIETWKLLADDLKVTFGLKIRRPYFSKPVSSCELHVFSDASPLGYGCCAYLVSETESCLTFAKARVAPPKTLTLPQLELTAVVVACRVASWLCSAFDSSKLVSKIFLWSDSQIALQWITNASQKKAYVLHRVREIRKTISSHDIELRFCPGSDNPADLCTRGIPAKELDDNVLWWHGPKWLCFSEERPVWNLAVLSVAETEEDQQHETVPETLEFERSFNSWSKLKRVTAWMLRFKENLKVSKDLRTVGKLSVSELIAAERLLIFRSQSRHFKEEILDLEKGSRRISLVRQLDLFLVDGMVKCRGRLQNAPLQESARHPILISHRDHLATLIVNFFHRLTLHGGVNTTVAAVRSRYWISHVRGIARSVYRKCVTCRKVVGGSYNAPPPAPLPACRLKLGKPFEVVGIDFTGALYIKNSPQTVENKVYICLFTCANSRAVHLELVESLSAKTFLLAFRKFCARRSIPRLIISDNATTFEAASSCLSLWQQNPELQKLLEDFQIKWKFIPKRAPWYGGFWERLVGLTKTTIRKVIGKARFTYDELATIITEVEGLLNDRPLTYISSDINDGEPITPSHLMFGHRIRQIPSIEAEDVSDPGYDPTTTLKDSLDAKREIILHFWKRWRHEYLTGLREHHKSGTGLHRQQIKEGDIVHVHDDTKRIFWKLAKVERLLKGRDGIVRAAIIRTASGTTNRPITKLYPLEVCHAVNPESLPEPQQGTSESTLSLAPASGRPSRRSAIAARAKISRWTKQLQTENFRPGEDVEDD